MVACLHAAVEKGVVDGQPQLDGQPDDEGGEISYYLTSSELNLVGAGNSLHFYDLYHERHRLTLWARSLTTSGYTALSSPPRFSRRGTPPQH